MSLQANTINANLLRLQFLHHFAYSLRLRAGALEVVIVIVQLGLGVELGSGLEGQVDELFSQNVVEHGLAVGAVLVEGLVYHVPCVALALVVVHDVGDVGDDDLLQFVLGPVGFGFHPGGELGVPDERMAPLEFVVLLGEGGDDVTFCEVEDALGRFGEEPLCGSLLVF